MQGAGTRDVGKGAWHEDLMYREYTTREQWKEYVKDQAATCKLPNPPLSSTTLYTQLCNFA